MKGQDMGWGRELDCCQRTATAKARTWKTSRESIQQALEGEAGGGTLPMKGWNLHEEQTLDRTPVQESRKLWACQGSLKFMEISWAAWPPLGYTMSRAQWVNQENQGKSLFLWSWETVADVWILLRTQSNLAWEPKPCRALVTGSMWPDSSSVWDGSKCRMK